MTSEEELKVRAQGESGMLSQFMSLVMSNVVTQAGEIAVLQAQLNECREALKPKKK